MTCIYATYTGLLLFKMYLWSYQMTPLLVLHFFWLTVYFITDVISPSTVHQNKCQTFPAIPTILLRSLCKLEPEIISFSTLHIIFLNDLHDKSCCVSYKFTFICLGNISFWLYCTLLKTSLMQFGPLQVYTIEANCLQVHSQIFHMSLQKSPWDGTRCLSQFNLILLNWYKYTTIS